MPERNTAARAAATENTVPSTKYSYNYNYVPPLAMVDVVSPAEGFAARPEWIHLVSISALKILFNSIMIGVRNKGNSIEFVPGVLQALNAVAQLLGPDTKRDLSNAIASELGTAGVSDYGAGIESVPGRSHRDFCEDAHAREFARHRAKPWEVCQLSSVQFPAWKITSSCSNSSHCRRSARIFKRMPIFAAMRVAGPNPLMIERMKALDARLPITEEQYQSVMGTQDSLEKAVADGRLYLADYSVFDGALNGSFPAAQKYNYAPLALFAVPPGGQSLVPVAIQCAPQPGPANPIFLPRDGDSWLIAKTTVQIADANFNEAVSHLGRTHLFIEPFIIATHNQLSPTHPLFILLTPHFEGTLAINEAAQRRLIAPFSLVDNNLSGTIDQSRVFAVKAAQSYQLNVNTSTLPQTVGSARCGRHEPFAGLPLSRRCAADLGRN